MPLGNAKERIQQKTPTFSNYLNLLLPDIIKILEEDYWDIYSWSNEMKSMIYHKLWGILYHQKISLTTDYSTLTITVAHQFQSKFTNISFFEKEIEHVNMSHIQLTI